MGKLRRYTFNSVNGVRKRVLVSWTIKQCKRCNKFLSKKQKLLCDECAKRDQYDRNKKVRETLPNAVIKWQEKYRNKNRFRENTRTFIFKHTDELNVGDILEVVIERKRSCKFPQNYVI